LKAKSVLVTLSAFPIAALAMFGVVWAVLSFFLFAIPIAMTSALFRGKWHDRLNDFGEFIVMKPLWDACWLLEWFLNTDPNDE
jgi:ABC-type dipeptide/oligopeptide/nickel transport system permease component